jgi:hypothetical protein
MCKNVFASLHSNSSVCFLPILVSGGGISHGQVLAAGLRNSPTLFVDWTYSLFSFGRAYDVPTVSLLYNVKTRQQQELMVILLGTATMIIFCYFPQDNVNEYPNIPGLYSVDDQHLRGLIW